MSHGPDAHYPRAVHLMPCVHLSRVLCARTHVINVINARGQPLTRAGQGPGASGARSVRRAVCRARVCRQAREHTSGRTQVANQRAGESVGTNQRPAPHTGGTHKCVRCSLYSLPLFEQETLALYEGSTIFVTECQLLMSVGSL